MQLINPGVALLGFSFIGLVVSHPDGTAGEKFGIELEDRQVNIMNYTGVSYCFTLLAKFSLI